MDGSGLRLGGYHVSCIRTRRGYIRAMAKAAKGPKLAISNVRRPFKQLEKLPKSQYAQLAVITANADAGTPEQCAKDDDWMEMELADVLSSAKPVYQLYVWPAGSGVLFEHNGKALVAMVNQHKFELTGDDDPALRRALAEAYTKKPLSQAIDFDRAKPATPKKSTKPNGMERLRKVLGSSKERYRLFEQLTKPQQDAIREEYSDLPSNEYFRHFENLGIPPLGAFGRWAGIEKPEVLEKRVGKWPVWRWLTAALEREISVGDAVSALTNELDAKSISDLVMQSCDRNNDQNDYELWPRERNGQRDINERTGNIVRLFGALIDGSGDKAAIEFAKRTTKFVEKHPQRGHVAVAAFALAARARRRGEAFPRDYYDLIANAETVGCSRYLRGALRDLYEVVPAGEREELLEVDGIHFIAGSDTEYRGDREVRMPVLLHAWLVADLIPTKKVAEAMVNDIARWDRDPKPKQDALEMIQKVGAICVPFIEKALKTTKSPHKAVLTQALALLDGDGKKPRA